MKLSEEEVRECERVGITVLGQNEKIAEIEYRADSRNHQEIANAILTLCVDQKIEGYLVLDLGERIRVEIMYLPVE